MCPEFQKNFQYVHSSQIKICIDAPNYCYEFEINSDCTKKKPVLYDIHVQYRLNNSPGNDLLFHKVTLEVSSALEDLTAVFGMSTGVSPPPLSPEDKLIRF